MRAIGPRFPIKHGLALDSGSGRSGVISVRSAGDWSDSPESARAYQGGVCNATVKAWRTERPVTQVEDKGDSEKQSHHSEVRTSVARSVNWGFAQEQGFDEALSDDSSELASNQHQFGQFRLCQVVLG